MVEREHDPLQAQVVDGAALLGGLLDGALGKENERERKECKQ